MEEAASRQWKRRPLWAIGVFVAACRPGPLGAVPSATAVPETGGRAEGCRGKGGGSGGGGDGPVLFLGWFTFWRIFLARPGAATVGIIKMPWAEVVIRGTTQGVSNSDTRTAKPSQFVSSIGEPNPISPDSPLVFPQAGGVEVLLTPR